MSKRHGKRVKIVPLSEEEAQAHYDSLVDVFVRMGNDLNTQHLKGKFGPVKVGAPMHNFKCGTCNEFTVGVALFERASAMICRKCGKVELTEDRTKQEAS